MSMHDRAAQFAPFAALTGYGEAVEETARLVDSVPILSDDENDILDGEMKKIRDNINEQPEITVLRFVPDDRKIGGKYESFTGRIRRLDEINRKMVFADGTEIYYDDIYKIEVE